MEARWGSKRRWTEALEIALAAELRSHAARVREALEHTPDPHVDWEQVFAQR